MKYCVGYFRQIALVCLVAIWGSGPGAAVAAETIDEALAAAYLSNPTLEAERARQRATDEQVSQAVSGWRPNLGGVAEGGYRNLETKPRGGGGSSYPFAGAVTFNQPIFRGFRTVNSTKQALATVRAGQQILLNTEQGVLFDAITAYMNVVRDQAIVTLREEDVRALEELLRGTEARFRVGEVTRTDVAQSRARLSQSQSALAAARASLATSRADYRQVIGRSPGTLQMPRPLVHLLPATLEEAIALGEFHHPVVLAAVFTAEATDYAIDVAKGELLPQIEFEARYQFLRDKLNAFDETEEATILGRVNVPIYQGGAEYSRVREAKQVHNQRRIEILEAQRSVREEVVTAWNLLIAAREQIASDRVQVEANQLAFEGIQQEALVGTRTVLDVLLTSRDLIESRVALVRSQRDEVVASYRQIASVGRLTARQLGLAVPIYDPELHLEEVRWKWFGLGPDRPE